MQTLIDQFVEHSWIVVAIVAVLIFAMSWRLVIRLFGIVIVADDSIGLVTKKFVLFGSNRELPAGKIIALKGDRKSVV